MKYKKFYRGIALMALSALLVTFQGTAETIRAQDDYYGYINYEHLESVKIAYGESYGGAAADMMSEVENEVSELILQIAKAEENYEKGSAEQLIQDVFFQYMEAESAKEEIKTALEGFAGQIKDARTTGELLAILQELAVEKGIPSYYNFAVELNYFKSEEHAIYLEQKTDYISVNLKGLYEGDEPRQWLQGFARYTLEAFGESEKDAGKRADDLVYFILEIARNTDFDIAEAVNPYLTFSFQTEEALSEGLKHTDIKTLEQVYGITENPYGGIYVQDEPQFRIMEKLFCEENLEVLKTYLLCELMYQYRDFLVSQYDFLSLYTEENYKGRENSAVTFINTVLDREVGNLYAEKYDTEEKEKVLTRMFDDIIGGYRALIKKADWLSMETREKLLLKLNRIVLVSGKSRMEQNKSGYQSYLGKNIIETYHKLLLKQYKEQLAMIGKPADKTRPVITQQVLNAGYRMDNTVTITTAIMKAPYFEPEEDYAKNLGGIGMVIAHEIGHAFDSNCIAYDADGNYHPSWIPEKERNVLKNRMKQMEDYYASFTIMDVYHVDGVKTCGENYADKGGMECIMEITKTDEERREVFENYARIWGVVKEDRVAIEQLSVDEHSPECIRVNAVLSSTEEFYALYGVKEGDGMYVEPDRRVRRW